MVSQDRISRLAKQIGDRLQGASQAPEEMQKGIQQVVRGAFDRLELVSREDFDILMDVLQRTRGRVEALEKQVAELEKTVQANQPTTATALPGTPRTAADATTGEGASANAADHMAADTPSTKGARDDKIDP